MKFKIDRYYSYVALVIAPLLWSGNFLIGRAVYQEIPPFQLSFYRWFFVIMFLLPCVGKSMYAQKEIILKSWKLLMPLSILSVTIYTSFVYAGLHYTSVVNASLLNATVPMLIVILSALILKEKMTTMKLLGSIASLLGVIILITRGEINLLFGMQHNYGDALILLAALSWAIFSVLYKRLPYISPFVFLFITALIGECILTIPFILELNQGYYMQVNYITTISIIYAAFFSSILAFTLWNIGVRNLGASQAGYFFNLLPVFGLGLAYLFLGERYHTYQLLGTCFVFLGIYITTRSKLVKYPQDQAPIEGLKNSY